MYNVPVCTRITFCWMDSWDGGGEYRWAWFIQCTCRLDQLAACVHDCTF